MAITCTFQKFINVTPQQFAELMRLIGSEHNCGSVKFKAAWRDSNGMCGAPGMFVIDKYRHITLMSATQKEDGLLTIEVKINTRVYPVGDRWETPDDRMGTYAPKNCTTYWSIRDDLEPAFVPRSLILAMHDTLGVFLTE